jgi:hypothetical protein
MLLGRNLLLVVLWGLVLSLPSEDDEAYRAAAKPATGRASPS